MENDEIEPDFDNWISQKEQKQLSDEEIKGIAFKKINYPLAIEIKTFIEGFKAALNYKNNNK